MYLFSFATVAAQDKPLTGAEVARGLARTVGGTPIVVGKQGLNQAFSVLSTDASIDFDGASGPLDWDLTTGEAPSDIVIWCIPNTGANPIQSGKIFSAEQGNITGVFKSACM
jgi:branched-chain amino acid transport system substrate-binding protein